MSRMPEAGHPAAGQPFPAAKAGLKTIGWFTAACVLVSNIIGGGIFTTTGFIARDIGDPGLILSLWVLGAVYALAGAISFSELGAALPHVGGDYVYLRRAYGPLMGFLSGWTSFTVGFGAAIAASSVSFASYALRIAPGPGDSEATAKALALVLVWGLTAVHALGIGPGGSVQRLLTSTKVLAIGALILGGLLFGAGDWRHLTAASPEAHPAPAAFVVAFIFVVYTYLGWNVVGYIAGEIADPSQNLPRIVIGGTAFVCLVYVLLNVVYLYALPVTALGVPPLLPVAEKAAAALWGPASGRFVAFVLCIAIAGAVSAMVWAGPRAYYAMARDGLFARFFSLLTPATGVPARAILLQSIWATLLILTGTFEQLVIFSGFVLALSTAVTIGAVIVLRHREPALPRPYRVPFYPWTPGLAIAISLIVIGYSLIQRPLESVFGIGTILAGVPFYFLWTRRGQ